MADTLALPVILLLAITNIVTLLLCLYVMWSKQAQAMQMQAQAAKQAEAAKQMQAQAANQMQAEPAQQAEAAQQAQEPEWPPLWVTDSGTCYHTDRTCAALTMAHVRKKTRCSKCVRAKRD